MKRKRRTLPIGPISEGTHNPKELMHAYINALRSITLTPGERHAVDRIYKQYSKNFFADEDLDELVLILDDHTPDLCTFGAHEGDGACFGVWVNEEGIRWAEQDGELRRGEVKPPVKATREPYFLEVNDHGNCTLYRKAGNRWAKVWSVV